MKTKVVAIAFAILMAVPFVSYSQEEPVTSAPKYYYDDETVHRNEISATIGTTSGAGTIIDLFKIVIEGVANSIGKNYKTDTKFIGTYGIDYYYQVNSWFRPGVKIGYEGLVTNVYDTTMNLVNHYHTSTVTVMPSVQFSYLNRKYVKLYSGIDIGFACFFDNNKNNTSPGTTIFAMNLTPIGIRVGNEWVYGLVETNIGFDAFIKAGIGVRF